MAFINTRFPESISYGAMGGPEFSTDIVVINSGFEQRNINWTAARCKFDVSQAIKSQADNDALIAFFRIAAGRGNSFRYKDWNDYLITVANGILGTGIGTGLPTYQTNKIYTNAGGSSTRKITRLVSGASTFDRNASLITVGGAAGNISFDINTGQVTFVADGQSTVTGVTVGATTQITLTGAITGLTTSAGSNLIYLAGLTGTDAALLNGIAHTITNIASNVYTISTNTAGKTITAAGSGYKYPQTADVLTFASEFDVPARFDIDQLNGLIVSPGVYSWENIPIVEIRE